MILILGSDHKGYKKRISSAVKALSDGRAEIDVKICEIVNFLKNGEPVKMSKRAGNFLLASDVVEEVDIDIMRFMMLTRRNDTILNFDFEKVKEQSKDNPVFYVQYANARCNSLINKAKLLFGEDILQTEKYSIPDNILVRNLITTISYYPETVGIAVAKHEPHLLIFYAIELASHFHSIWNSGFRFVVENDKDLTRNNLCVIKSVSQVISSILACCNIKPVESM